MCARSSPSSGPSPPSVTRARRPARARPPACTAPQCRAHRPTSVAQGRSASQAPSPTNAGRARAHRWGRGRGAGGVRGWSGVTSHARRASSSSNASLSMPPHCRWAAIWSRSRVLSRWRARETGTSAKSERSGRCWRAVLPCAHWWRGARCRPMPASRWPRALTPSFPAASSNSTTGSLSLHGASARRSSALLPQEARPSHGNKAGGERQRAADARVRSAELVHSRARA